MKSDAITMTPVTRPLRGTVRPPGSKSLTNRALIIAALADGVSQLSNVLDSVDTQVMINSLKALGISVVQNLEEQTVTVTGCCGQIPRQQAELWLENSGTSIRFLTALCVLGNGTYRLDGNARMRQRPIGDLVRGLQELKVAITCEMENDCPPVTIHAKGLEGGKCHIQTGLSSQFLSALLMSVPYAQTLTELHVQGAMVSEPYIDMTLGVMARFGVLVDTSLHGRYSIAPQHYRGTQYEIEPDASAASYFFAAAAITGGEITVEGLNEYALQGDLRFLEALEQMGCRIIWHAKSVTVLGQPLQGIEIDMNAFSDTAQTLAAVAPFASGPTKITNVAHMRHKETDRISAVATELRKLGIRVDEEEAALTIYPGPLQPATIDTYDDHRMAMSFALIGLKSPGITILDPGCTSKTYPHYFQDLARLCENAL